MRFVYDAVWVFIGWQAANYFKKRKAARRG